MKALMKVKAILCAALAAVLFITTFVPFSTAYADGGLDRSADFSIANINIVNHSNPTGPISYNSSLDVNVNFSFASVTSIALGDYFDITLPAGLDNNDNLLLANGTYELKNEPGGAYTVGHFTVSGTQIRVNLDVDTTGSEFPSNAKVTGMNAVSGFLYFGATMSFTRFEGSRDFTFTFITNGVAQSKTISVGGWPAANPISKSNTGYDGYPAYNYANDEIA